MATLSEIRIATLVAPYLDGTVAGPSLIGQLSAYLDLLVKWNARTNLTAIRDPEEMVRRHFGESLFAGVHMARRLGANAEVLDFGSGAGFPGLPIQLLCPELRVTLAESQGKKASFLREAVRTLGVGAEVWAGRVETLPVSRRFGAVTLRAVDHMQQAVAEARGRVVEGGWLATLATEVEPGAECVALPEGGGWLTLVQVGAAG